eukprot:NODE_3060_length_1058_cov_37.191278_g2808_i0.p2 GENE.NODE_3060_length_1058_cov_37.191278_g2808_i0~~NODE_3060_length_1058_cov_37.191278_g2808_i0.p2  ORF type:complete len:192 (+),score=17.23 NODE_3060_length_1058_cov_37.191278_g2808_i0:228-803(+)
MVPKSLLLLLEQALTNGFTLFTLLVNFPRWIPLQCPLVQLHRELHLEQQERLPADRGWFHQVHQLPHWESQLHDGSRQQGRALHSTKWHWSAHLVHRIRFALGHQRNQGVKERIVPQLDQPLQPHSETDSYYPRALLMRVGVPFARCQPRHWERLPRLMQRSPQHWEKNLVAFHDRLQQLLLEFRLLVRLE